MAKMSKSKRLNQKFIDEIKPRFEQWGLAKHPNPRSHFGGCEHGYRYDFADLSDRQSVKLASFAIINQLSSHLWIRAYKIHDFAGSPGDLIILDDKIKDIYVLSRGFSFRHFFSRGYSVSQHDPDEVDKVVRDVCRRIFLIKEYLYEY
jgi:hypothetical protein